MLGSCHNMLSGVLNLLGIFLLPPFLVLPLVLRPVSDGVVLNMENRVSFIFFFGSFNGERHFCGHYISFENVDFVLLKSHVCFVYICHCFLLYEPLLHFASHTLFRKVIHALSFDFCWLCLSKASVTPWICGIKDRTYEKLPFCVQWRGCSS